MRSALLLAASLCLGTAHAQFGPPIIAFDADHLYPSVTQLADLDLDGDLDALIGTFSGTSWFANDGMGQFGPRVVIGGGYSGYLSVQDIDDDGDPDVVASGDAWPSSHLGWYANDGVGNFTAMNLLSTSIGYSQAPQWADLDGDGDVDLVARVNGYVRAYFNDGAGIFTAGANLSGYQTSGTLTIAVDDADNDGDNDVLVFGNAPQDGYYENLGAGSFAAAVAITEAYADRMAALWDIDADGDRDLLINYPVRWLMNDGTATYTTGDTVMNGWVAGHVADTDTDGDPDLFGGSTTLNVEEYRYDDSTFTTLQIEFVQGYSLGGVRCAAGDINGDGHDDLLVCNGMGMFGWYAGDGNNGWGIRQNIGSVLTWPHDAVVGDLDLDGDPDMVTIGYHDDRFAWYANDGTGMLGAQQPIADNMNGPEDIAILDLDLDGDSDLVLMNTLAANVVRAWNNGSGSFIVDTIAIQPARMAVAHLNADPYSDLVAGDAWYSNDSNGNFTLEVDLGLPGTCIPACGDMDGDGTNDIVILADQLYVIKEINGPLYTQLATPAVAILLDLCDLDADGDLDVATIGNTTYNWYENDGTGNLTQHVWATGVPTFPVSLVARDVNGDGAGDMIWARSSGYLHELYYALNDGQGGFGPYTLSATRGNYAIGLADMNGDLVEDLWSADPNDIAWQENHFYNAFRLRGSVFMDFDLDATLDSAEFKVPFRLVRSEANDLLIWTNSAGDYDLPADTGTWRTWHTPSPSYQVTNDPDTLLATLTTLDPIADGLDIGLAPVLQNSASFLSITYSGPFRCNTDVVAWIHLRNTGTFIPEGIVIDYEVHPDLTVGGAWPTPDSIVGNHFYWSVDSLGWFQEFQAALHILIGPAGSNAGFGYSVTAANMSLPYAQPLVPFVVNCAFDPNDKLVTPQGFGAAGAVPIDQEWLEYTVRFQNTGNDTAFTVQLLDTLDMDLDPLSMEVLAASHPLTRIQVDANNVALFRFERILLPDSNVNEPASHGFVKYRIKPVAGSPHLTEITNSAAIYFDLNEPVITNTVLNTLVDCGLHSAAITDIGGGLLEATDGASYQWFLNGGTLAGDTLQQLTVPMNGDYTVQVTSEYGCVSLSDPYTYLTTNIAEAADPHVRVAPNPMGDQAVMHFSGPLTAQHRIELVDVSGRVVRVLRPTGRSITLLREGLSAGAYTVLLMRNKEVIGAARVVVQ